MKNVSKYLNKVFSLREGSNKLEALLIIELGLCILIPIYLFYLHHIILAGLFLIVLLPILRLIVTINNYININVTIKTLKYVEYFRFILSVISPLCLMAVLLWLSNTKNELITIIFYLQSLMVSIFFLFFIVSFIFIPIIIKKRNKSSERKRRVSSFKIFKYIAIFSNITFFYYLMILLFSYNADVNIKYTLVIIYVILTMIFYYYFIKASFPRDYKTEAEEISISFLNLDMQDVLDDKFYIYNQYPEYNSYRIFKINLENLFPKGSTEREIRILNQACYQPLKSYPKKDKTYCYLAIRRWDLKYLRKVEFFLFYKTSNSKTNKIRLNLFIETANICGELVITNKYVNKYQNVLFSWCYREYYYNRKKFNLNKIYELCYQYQNDLDLFENDILLETNTDNRKWVHHEGEYGAGKTSLDLLAVLNSGLNPIVISPWVANYDQDLLSLIFEKINERSKMMLYYPNKSCLVFFLAEFIAFTTSIYFALDWLLKIGIDIVLGNTSFSAQLINLYTTYNANYNFSIIKPIIFLVFASGIAFLLACYFLPHIILFKKDSTKIYQSFYLKQIRKMLLKEKIVLIVEDVDRLNGDALDNMFRTISSINEACWDVNRIIGIVSYSTKNISTLVNTGKQNDILVDIENKIIYDKVFKNYSAIQSIIKYLKQGILALSYIQSVDIENCSKINRKINEIDFSKYNFRTVHKFLDELSSEPTFTTREILEMLEEEFLPNNKKSFWIRRVKE